MSISTHVGALAAGQVYRLLAVGGLADHLEVIGGVEQHAEPRPDQGLIVSQQNPDHSVVLLCSGHHSQRIRLICGR
jgi:hypothetical protein